MAGLSGGSAEAVIDGETGYVVDDPGNPSAAVEALARLLDVPEHRQRMGAAARKRAETEFSYDVLAQRLGSALDLPASS